MSFCMSFIDDFFYGILYFIRCWWAPPLVLYQTVRLRQLEFPFLIGGRLGFQTIFVGKRTWWCFFFQWNVIVKVLCQFSDFLYILVYTKIRLKYISHMSLYGELLWKQLIKYIVSIMYYFWLRFFSGPSFFSFGRAARFLDVHLMRNRNSNCRSLMVWECTFYLPYWR